MIHHSVDADLRKINDALDLMHKGDRFRHRLSRCVVMIQSPLKENFMAVKIQFPAVDTGSMRALASPLGTP